MRESEGLQWIEFSPNQLGVFGMRGPQGGFIPFTADEVIAANPEFAAVLDGPMFEKCGGGHAYESYTCGDPGYLLADGTLQEATEHPSRGGTIYIKDGVAEYASGAPANLPGIAVQGYPSLLENGENVASLTGQNAERGWRAALVLLENGNLAFAVGQDTMPGFAARLKRIGGRYAVYTDGGGSAKIVTQNGERAGSSENRRVPVYLVVRQTGLAAGLSTPTKVVIGVSVALALTGIGVAVYTHRARRR